MKCRVCNRALKNQKWIDIGMGPVCTSKAAVKEIREDAQADLPFDGSDVVLERPKGKIRTNVPHRWKHHSPAGFEWGYSGSGPADLALNILLLFGVNRVKAFELHHEFKSDFLARLPIGGGRISGDAIRTWIGRRISS